MSVSLTGTDVGGAWAYRNDLTQHGANSGIGSAGLGLFGDPNVFPGANVDSDPGVDGLGYGLASVGDIPTTGNGGIKDRELTKNSVVFLFSGLPPGFALSNINNVTFQYGTALSEPNFPGSSGSSGSTGGNITSSGQIPEPGTLSLLGAAILGGLFHYRRRRQANV
ncbi:MAG: PEP-CTERM sorting domain-containing protein [Candidatus Competibacteraceae bacterium]|nr:PEP-CTERM sorting domain-containing protein [Candidatus Competibacteraceae bacterium]